MATHLFFLALATETAAQNAPAPTGLSIKEQTVTAYYRAVDAGDRHGMRTRMSANMRASLPVAAEPLPSEPFLDFIDLFRLGFPDMRHEVQRATDVGNRLIVEGRFTGTHSGPFNGQAPTYRRVSLPFTTTFTFNTGGLIARLDVRFDPLEVQRQVEAP